jgi:hypothetical protein
VTYAKYVSFLKNFAPCILGFLSGIMFQGFCSVIKNWIFLWSRSRIKAKSPIPLFWGRTSL